MISKEMAVKDAEFLRNFDPVIYWNDVGCYYWGFDQRLPSGRWITNITLNYKHKLKYKIMKSMKEQEEEREQERLRREEFFERQAKEQERKELAQKQSRDDWQQETSDYISKCMDGLITLDKIHKIYFGEHFIL